MPKLADENGKAPKPRPHVTTRPNKEKLSDVTEGLLIAGNVIAIQWAGQDPVKQLLTLSEKEIELETKAIVELLMSYPGLYSYLTKVQNAGPMAAFMQLQIVMASERLKRYKALEREREEKVDYAK